MTRNTLALVLFLASGCLARDFGKCANGATRQGDECVLTVDDASSIRDGGESKQDASNPDGSGDGDDSGLQGDTGKPKPDGGTAPTCNRSTECDADAPLCADQTCSGCKANSDCSRFASVALPACGANGNCVECTSNEHCVNPLEPVCGEDNLCASPCRSDLDCQRASSAWTTPYCELGKGRCSGCIPGALEEAQCTNGNACDPVAMACTGAPRESIQNCYPCSTDTECATGLYCVATEARGAPSQRYCVLRKDSGACPNRFSLRRTATSVLGVTAPFCFPDEQHTTCEAVMRFNRPCAQNSECGATGLCVLLDGTNKCTYECDDSTDCSTSCIGIEPSYCKPT